MHLQDQNIIKRNKYFPQKKYFGFIIKEVKDILITGGIVIFFH